MAFSHCSTLVPRMKCCDSITSAMAASTSSRMVEYCALRSSSGTFIFGLPLQVPVGLGADAQFAGQAGLLVEVEAAQHARFNFLVAIAGFRAPHDPLGIGGSET